MIPANRAAALVVTGVLGLSALSACSSSTQPGASSSSSGSATTSESTSPSASASAGSGSPSASGAASTSPGSTKTATITIKDFKYSGAGSVPAGTQITVKNDDTEAHTVTSDTSGAFDVKIDPGKSATFAAPDKAGSFPYHCTFHGNMHGTLKVS
jgi:plastocyanin